MKEYRAIGLMSGTSLDGVDAALLRTDGHAFVAQEGWAYVPYPAALREKIRACFNKPPDPAVERELTLVNAEAVKKLLAEKKLRPDDVNFVGFHGQTISHAPERGHTCQMGDGKLLAQLIGIDVVNDLRAADVKAGGQGAPMLPVYHEAMMAGQPKPAAVLNIGGISNVTFIPKQGELLSFDLGAGSALLDDWMREKTGKFYDENGATAKAGTVDKSVVERMMAHPFFEKKPPKSLDRNAFSKDLVANMTLENGAATLAAFTVRGILKALQFLPEKPLRWIVAGGGRKNEFFMEAMRKHLGVEVIAIEDLGFNGNATEAEGWAYLAVRSYLGLPLSFPGTTGVWQPTTGGVLHRARDEAA